jgi:hypothetical protein
MEDQQHREYIRNLDASLFKERKTFIWVTKEKLKRENK